DRLAGLPDDRAVRSERAPPLATYTGVVDFDAFEQHLRDPRGRGPVPAGALVGSAGGNACDDLVRIALRADRGRVAEISFDADGCGATVAAASACVTLVE